LIISADSLGGIKFWDGHTFTLLQSFQPYENDVLALAINLNGDQIFAAGIDGRLTMLQRVNYKWSVVQQRRIHMNDIRSLVWVQKYAAPTAKPAASSTNHGGGKRSRGDADDDSDNHQDGDTQKRNKQQLMVDVLISGGVDTYLTLQVEPTQRFSSSRSHQFQQPVRIPPFPTPRQQQQPMVRVCAKQRLLVSYQADTVSIWRLGRPSRTVDSGTDLIPIVGGGGEFLAQIKLRAGRHVQFIDIDRNGQYLAVGDGNGCLSVYELALNSSPAATSTLLLRNITRRLPDMLPAVQLATFAGHYLVVACHGGMVYIFDNVESEFRLKRSWLVGGKVATGDDNSASPIAYLCADDEQFVVCGDLMNRVSVLNTQSGDITELPAVQGGLYTCMSLIRLPEPHLLIAMASMRPSDSSSRAKSAEGGRARYKNRILFYDLTRMRFNGAVESALAQIEWLGSRREKITGITSAVCDDPSTGSTSPSLFIHCPQWIGRVDLSKAVEYAGKLAETKEKSARGALKTSLESTWSACSEFDNILHFSLLSSSASASSSSLEAVVVERPWSSIVEDMPAPVYVKQYGQ
jgi:hypothetical protein